MRLLNLSGILFFILICSTVHGQVTIGSSKPAVEGAILDLKEFEPNSQGHDLSTARKGLLLPRMVLQKQTSLGPIIAETDPNLVNQKEAHIGLVVFHLGGNNMEAGPVVWDGEQWASLKNAENTASTWFYMPGFPIDISDISLKKVNLYDEYRRQFSSIPDYELIAPGKLKFVITGYDEDSFRSASINPTTQELEYQALPAFISSKSYINIICVVLP